MIDMIVLSHNSVEGYYSKIVAAFLANLIIFIIAYLEYTRKTLFVEKVLLNKEVLVLKFSMVIFSYIHLLSSVNKPL